MSDLTSFSYVTDKYNSSSFRDNKILENYLPVCTLAVILSSIGRLQDLLRPRRPQNAKRIHQESSIVSTPTTTTTTTVVEWKVEENDTVTIPCYGIVHQEEVV